MKMLTNSQLMLSVVIPVYNEAAGIERFHASLLSVLKNDTAVQYEIIYVDDGSTDDGLAAIRRVVQTGDGIKILRLSRNFGKEIATTAGIHAARGQAILTLDADGQHPVELIPQFIAAWQRGAKVVVGVRTANQRAGLVKHYGSKVFYKVFNRLTGIKLVDGATDFRLIDRSVQQEFIQMTERNRITRGLISWLGYPQEYIYFSAKPRIAGTAAYSFTKLVKLFIDSIISHSLSPLYLTAYIGALVLPASVLMGLGMAVNLLFRDPLRLHATGGAYLMVFILFLIGILLVSQGIIGLYLSHIHTETQNRPLYVIDKAGSEGFE
jgi:glycosyltransferase involved in cell wall biosynthesis